MQESDLTELCGTVEKIIYQSETTGYTVCDLATQNDELVTAVGVMPYLCEGETIRASGKFVTHSQFGRQFQVEIYEKELPATETAMLKYLSSGAVKGIGKATAKKIIEKFGEDTFDVLEHNPEWLADIGGISLKKAKAAGESFRTQFGMRNVMMFFRDFFGPLTSVKIYKKWGAGAVDVVKQNPYLLCDEISGVGFEKADEIARTLGVSPDSRERTAAGIKFVLNYNQYQNGHVFLPMDKLIETSRRLLGCDKETAENEIGALVMRGELVLSERGGRKCIYTKRMFEAEDYIAKKLDIMESVERREEITNITALIEKIQIENDIIYDRNQKKAITDSINNGVFILTGGPGTGKTTVSRALIRIYESMGLSVVLCAPTGRAAKRMSDATGREAKTIHRMLEMERGEDENDVKFRRNENDMIEDDVIIVDESSMIDVYLMEALLKAIKSTARLVMIGDASQLPPVGPGYVFRDIIASERYNTVELTYIFRQARQSLIVTNAHAVNSGEHLDLSSRDGDFFFLARQDDAATAATVVELCKKRLPKSYGLSVYDGIQVITPSRKGECGTESLCAALQAAINPPALGKRELKRQSGVLREGDKVMQIKNDYSAVWEKDGTEGQGIFNGDIGVILKIDREEEIIRIDFEGRIADYDFASAEELEPAYAITVHKSQGSEYPIVIIPLYRYSPKLLTRNLLYTAITRAQKMVILVGDGAVADAMIDNNRQTKRYTGLKYILGRYDDE